ncbi:FtsX-like permease family protein [Luteimicrobium subarcticum]|uniref:FtsX-like permease family protein n=1 Tax=Luteimicrobium subarcticum TaxID=620910 RepID=A0A2M8WSG6_9MICO|nr:FtsX-like permease family protein [Luteimicrobium subarcticum]PJI93881.1 FtsX-like permease family protein [Luteimicrobium subarcticum]
MTRLALRLLRGGGRTAALRLVLMAGGVAVTVTALLGAWSLLNGLDHGNDRAVASTPTLRYDDDRPGFLVRGAGDEEGTGVGLRPVARWEVALPDGATARPEWVPPGCPHFPAPGEACLSPALRDVLARTPGLAAALGASGPTETVGQPGLRGPDALVLYVGRAPAQLAHADRGTVATAWRGDRGGTVPPVAPGTAALEWLVLVGVPAVLFLGVCARLSSTTRLRRTRALRLVGLTSRQSAFVAAFDGRVAGCAGALVGLGAHASVQAAVGRAGLLGVTWFPSDGRVPWGLGVLVVVVATLGVGRVCRVGMLRAADSPTQRVTHRPARRWRLVPLAVAVPGTIALLAARTRDPSLGGAAYGYTAAVAGCLVGLMLALRPLVERTGAVLGDRTRHVAVRLAARRLQADASATVRVLAATVVLVLVAAVGTSVLAEVRATAQDYSPLAEVSVDLGHLDAAQRDAVVALPATRVVTVALDVVGADGRWEPPAAGAPRQIVYASCADLRRVEPTLTGRCVDGHLYRAVPQGWTSGTHAGTQVVLPGPRAGTGTRTTVPSDALVTREYGLVLGDGLVMTGPPPAGNVPDGAQVVFWEPRTDADLVALQTAIARVAPAAEARLGDAVGLLAAYAAQRGLVEGGAVLGFGLGALAFLVAAVDRSAERRRSLALLRAVGTGPRTLRAAQVLELAVPAALVLVPTAVVGALLGNLYRALGGASTGWSAAPLATGLALAALALAACAVVGVFVAQRRTGVRDLVGD